MKQSMRLVLMSLFLIVSGAAFAQTTVVFEAGIDKGSISGWSISGEDKIEKNGVTFGGTYAKLGENPYQFNSMFTQKLTVSSTVGKIVSVVLEGSNLGKIKSVNEGSFDAYTGTWTGLSSNIEMSYTVSSFKVKKVTVTLASTVSTTLSFGTDAQPGYNVYKGKESAFAAPTAIVTENKENTQIEGAAVKYASSNAEVVSVDENTGTLTFGSLGTATITASYAGEEGVYDAAADISYTINYSKNPLTLAYECEHDTVFGDEKDSYSAPVLTLTSGEEVVEGLAVAYASSNPEVATVNEDGKVTILATGDATITATVENDEMYEDASASFSITCKKRDYTFFFERGLDVIYVDDKDSYVAPLLVMPTHVGTGDMGELLTFGSSNTETATVDSKGNVTVLALGETIITAAYAGNDLYEPYTASYTLRVADPENIFCETFDNVEGTGGNDGTWESGDGDTFDDGLCDNGGWYEKSTTGGLLQTVLPADKCLNIFGQASLISPDMKYLNGTALLTFKAGAAVKNNPMDPTLKITVVDADSTILEQSVKLSVGEFKEYSIVIPNGTPTTRLEFWGEHACFWGGPVNYNVFIDDVKIVKLVAIAEDADNAAAIAANDGKSVNIKLDRKLSSENWNAVCFPFSLNSEEVAEMFGETASIRRFHRVENSEMVFVEATEIEAGVPYLFKPASDVDGSIFFRGSISAANTPAEYTDNAGNVYRFVGVTGKTELLPTDVMLGADCSLYYPDAETEGANIINGMSAYIQMPEGMDAGRFTVNTDGVPTAIDSLEPAAEVSGMIYTIGGQPVGRCVKSLQKGIYVVNGKKLVVE